MSMQLIGGDANNAQLANTANDIIREVQAMQTTEIFKDDTGTRRVLLGKGADGFYGLKVSKPTFDVYTAGADDLAFNSDQNVFKIAQSGTVTLTADGTDSLSETVAHGLGYIPAVIAYAVYANGYHPLPLVSIHVGSGVGRFQANFYVDATNVTFYNEGYVGYVAETITIKYYLLQETAN